MSTSHIRVCVVGPGKRFLSGITYHTYGLCQAMEGRTRVSALLLRRLLPRRLYPGSTRVGADLSRLELPPGVPCYDGIDWFWFPSLLRGVWFLWRQRPHVIVLQWWTGAVLHSYLVLAALARLRGCSVVVELHETQDPGEELVPLAQRYVRALAPVLFRLSGGFIVHSEFDRDAVVRRFGLPRADVVVIAGTLEPYGNAEPLRQAPTDVCNLLFFGVVRPFKGLEDLIEAFNSIPACEIDRYWLTIVGETWQDCLNPSELIAGSPYRDRITTVNRYVTDSEVEGYFAGADVVVLPYRRPCFSGPLLVALNYGLPIVATRVGGILETLDGYEGSVLVEPNSPEALGVALRRDAVNLKGQRFQNARTWQTVAEDWVHFLVSVTGIGDVPNSQRRSPLYGRVSSGGSGAEAS